MTALAREALEPLKPHPAPRRRGQRSGHPGYPRTDRLPALGACARLRCRIGTQGQMCASGTLASEGLALDLYSWFAQRLHRVPRGKPQFIAWAALKE